MSTSTHCELLHVLEGCVLTLNKYYSFFLFVILTLIGKIYNLISFYSDSKILKVVIELLVMYALIRISDKFLSPFMQRICENYNIKLVYLYLAYVIVYLIIFVYL